MTVRPFLPLVLLSLGCGCRDNPWGVEGGPMVVSRLELTDDGGRVDWCHESDLIAFDREDEEGDMEVYTIQPDGTGETCVTCDMNQFSRGIRGQPDWHPGCESMLIAVRNEHYEGTRFEHPAWGINDDLWLIAADGSWARQMVETPALGAVLHLADARGERHLPYDEMHVAYRQTALWPGELIVRVRFPVPEPDSVQAFEKVGTRAAQAISKVVVAFAAGRDGSRLCDVRLAAGSVAAVPLRLTGAERALEGVVPDEQAADAACDAARAAVTPLDDVRSTAAYRTWVLGRVVRRMVLDAGATADAPILDER